MAVDKQLWHDEIVSNLYENNSFLQYAKNDSAYANALFVHIQQAGAKPNVVKNRVNYPIPPVSRVDTDIVYPIVEYSTDTVVFRDEEANQEAPGKRQDILMDHSMTLIDTIGNDVIFQWISGYATTVDTAALPSAAISAASILRSTGSATPARTTSATGNRTKFTYDDILRAASLLDNQLISRNNRYILLTPGSMTDIMSDTRLQYDLAYIWDAQSGTFRGTIAGFTPLIRATVAIFDNTATPVLKAVGATGATTDNEAIFFWQRDCVSYATKEIRLYEDLNNPEFQGDIYSATVRMGARKRRSDAKGTGVIVQSAIN